MFQMIFLIIFLAATNENRPCHLASQAMGGGVQFPSTRTICQELPIFFSALRGLRNPSFASGTQQGDRANVLMVGRPQQQPTPQPEPQPLPQHQRQPNSQPKPRGREFPCVPQCRPSHPPLPIPRMVRTPPPHAAPPPTRPKEIYFLGSVRIVCAGDGQLVGHRPRLFGNFCLIKSILGASLGIMEVEFGPIIL